MMEQNSNGTVGQGSGLDDPLFFEERSRFVRENGTEFKLNDQLEKTENRLRFTSYLNNSHHAILESIHLINALHVPLGASGIEGAVVYFEFLGLNAFSSRKKKYDFIGFEVGLAAALWRCTFFTVKCLYDIREGIDEDLPEPRERSMIMTKDADVLDFPDIILDSRQGFSGWHTSVFVAAMRWVAHHEIAHIWNGHLDYTLSNDRKSSFVPDDYIQMALEIDADSRAVSGIFVDLQSPRFIGYYDEARRKSGDRAAEYIVLLNFVGVFIALSLHIIVFVGKDMFLKRHPPPYMRLLGTLERLQFTLKSWSVVDIRDDDFAKAALTVVSRTLKSEFHLDWARMMSTDEGPKTAMRLEDVHHAWSSICHDVVKHTRGFQLPGPYVNGKQSSFVYRDGEKSRLLGEAIKSGVTYKDILRRSGLSI